MSDVNTVPATRIIALFGKVLDPQSSYVPLDIRGSSVSGSNVDVFFSHVWGSSPKSRWLGILWYINWSRAAPAALTLSMIVSVITCQFIDGRKWTYFEREVGLTAMSLLALFGVFVSVILFFTFEGIFPRKKKCFLDRCSIEQESTPIKIRGIKQIPEVLAKSRSLVVLLSDDYFDRLWCIYELAIYRSAMLENPLEKKEIVFVPLRIVLLILLLTLVDLIATTLFRSNIRSYISRNNADAFQWISIAFSATTAALIYFFCYLWHEGLMRYRRQLSKFAIDQALCSEESDRTLLIADIEKRFIGRENFEEYVRTELHGQIASRPRMRYLFWICLPSLLAIVGYINIITQRMGLFCFQQMKDTTKVVARSDSFCVILDRSTFENTLIILVEAISSIIYYPVIVSFLVLLVSHISRLRTILRYPVHLATFAAVSGITYAKSLQFENQLLASGIQLGSCIAVGGLVLYLRWRTSAIESERAIRIAKAE
jgi:hypothetical protein